MTDELEGDIVSFRPKKVSTNSKMAVGDSRLAQQTPSALLSKNIDNNIKNDENNKIYTSTSTSDKNNKLSKSSLPRLPNPPSLSNLDLVPEDIIRKSSLQDKNSDKCEITGEIIPYKKPVGIPPEGGGPPPEGGVPSVPTCCPPTDLSPITTILEELKNFLIGYSETGTYFELRTQTTVATSTQPATPDTIADPNAFIPIPGYDAIDVNKQKQGKNAPKLWIINDGPPAPGVGDNLYVITCSDGMTFSPEFLMIVGETRLVNNVYEVRIRSPRQGDVVRLTEREPHVPYVTTVTNTLSPVANRSSFTAISIQLSTIGVGILFAQLLPSITIPDSFSLVVRAYVDNPGTSRIYVAGPIPVHLPDSALTNVQNINTRITLAPGDVVKYTINNANIIAIAGNLGTARVDITVEL